MTFSKLDFLLDGCLARDTNSILIDKTIKCIFVCLLFATLRFSATAQYFDHPIHYPGEIQSTNVYHGDFDDNGLLDFVIVTWNNAILAVNYQVSNGVYESKKISAGLTMPGPVYSLAIEVADLNHDGKDDIVAFNNYQFSNKKLFILLSDGPTFKAPIIYEDTNCLWSLSLTIADFNNDQHPDFFIGVEDPSMELVGYKGAGDGTFERFTVPDMKATTRQIRAADFNQDGHLDFAAQNASGKEIYLYYGNSNLGFSYHTTLMASGATSEGLVCADFNQDNYPEVISASGGNNNAIDYFTNNGNGGYTRKSVYLFGGRYAMAATLRSFDLHNDNKMDFIIGDFGNMSPIGFQIFENTGAHNFNASAYGVPRNGLIQDLKISPLETGFETIFLPTPYEVMTYQMTTTADVHLAYQRPTGLSLTDVAFMDLDNDGHKDIVGANTINHSISIQYNNGDRTFAEPIYFYTIDTPYDVEIADINSDGFHDIVYCTLDQLNLTVQNDLGVFYGDGSGNFPTWQTFPYSGYALAVADFNKDGRSDILTGNTIMLSSGATNLIPNFFSTSGEFRRVVAIDIDQDGNQDIVTLSIPDKLRVSFGTGIGEFPNYVEYQVDISGQDDLEVLDTNNDNLPEIYVSNLHGYGISQFTNQGNRTFAKKIINSTERVSSMAIFDFNNDSYPDLATALFHSSNHRVFNGNAQHDFLPSTMFGAGLSSLELKLEDLDNDGFLDIFSLNNSVIYSILYGRTSNPGPAITPPVIFYPCYVNPNPNPDPDPVPNPDPDPEPCTSNCRCDFMFPNIITPNGDDKNEAFKGSWQDATQLVDARINIYNRWGQWMATTGIEGWNAANVATGVYFWTCTYTCRENGQEVVFNKRGIVSVVH